MAKKKKLTLRERLSQGCQQLSKPFTWKDPEGKTGRLALCAFFLERNTQGRREVCCDCSEWMEEEVTLYRMSPVWGWGRGRVDSALPSPRPSPGLVEMNLLILGFQVIPLRDELCVPGPALSL